MENKQRYIPLHVKIALPAVALGLLLGGCADISVSGIRSEIHTQEKNREGSAKSLPVDKPNNRGNPPSGT